MLLVKVSRAVVLCISYLGLVCSAHAQSPVASPIGINPPGASTGGNALDGNPDIEEFRRELRKQQEELGQLRAVVTRQSQVIDALLERMDQRSRIGEGKVVTTNDIPVSDNAPPDSPARSQSQDTDARLARVEEQSKKTSEMLSKLTGAISFSGDIRLRYESFYGQLNALTNGGDPTIAGNELSARQRFRFRARLALRGQLGKEFDWGLRLASGSYTDSISTNQTLTDFYNRKAFGLDQAFVAWTPQRLPGLRLQGGKFDIPWTRTELTLDSDLQVEGFSQSYTRGFKNSTLKNLSLVAWELPFLERNSAFVRNANGTVNLEESRRGGRDLALYGAQIQARFEPTKQVALTLTASDLFFSGTQFISPVQFFGNLLQLPVTFTVPATDSSPAQTVTAQLSIPRDLLVAGAGNLGISTATNNAVNRDGRLSSGYNLVDLIGRLEWTRYARFPLTLLFNFVTNSQTHDVSVAGAGGATIFLPNHENNGYWAEFQMGRNKERGDVLFGYTFIRIEKDAVLTPFNFSDLSQQSDTRAHRLIFNYTAHPRVGLSVISIINQRPNGLLGVFGTTPQGSLNRPTTRLQFDTTFRF